MASETKGTVVVALGANLGIALAKSIGGLITGSSSLLSEAAHSFADTFNEVFLLLSLKKGDQPADRTHPFGYGKERFFWSLLAAVGIFVSGAGFALYQGIEALVKHQPEPSTRQFTIVYVVLAVSLILESGSLAKALKQVRREAIEANRSTLDFVRSSPDPTVKTVASEDTVAVVGSSLPWSAPSCTSSPATSCGTASPPWSSPACLPTSPSSSGATPRSC